MGKLFTRVIKAASSKDMLSAFSIFNAKKVPSLSTHELPLYGDSAIQTFNGQFGRDLPAKSLEETEFEKAAIVSSDHSTEWKTYRQLHIKGGRLHLKPPKFEHIFVAIITSPPPPPPPPFFCANTFDTSLLLSVCALR